MRVRYTQRSIPVDFLQRHLANGVLADFALPAETSFAEGSRIDGRFNAA
jgi:hypothetical protein